MPCARPAAFGRTRRSRATQVLQAANGDDDAVTFENYDDTHYGYRRLIADPRQLRIEYHPASDGAGVKTPDDSVTIDFTSRQQSTYQPVDLGLPARAMRVRSLMAAGAGARVTAREGVAALRRRRGSGRRSR